MPFGWSDEPLYAEQKLANLFYTVENTLNTLQKAYKLGNALRVSTLDKLEFQEAHGYRAVMKYDSGPIFREVATKWGDGHILGGFGYWMVYAERIGSLGDDRHKWPVWDVHQSRYEAPPKGLLSRELPHDYLGDIFDRNPQRPPTEDILIVATIEKNKWRPGPHNIMPDFLSFKK